MNLEDVVIGKTYELNMAGAPEFNGHLVTVVGKDAPDAGMSWPVEVVFQDKSVFGGTADVDPSELVEV